MRNEKYHLIIEPECSEFHYWRDLWRYRELFWFLSWRDILVRYKQTSIGIAWSLLRPLTTMIVFFLIFGKLAMFPSEGVPYPILIFAAMLPWQFFANALTESSNSLIANSNILTKVFFPRLIIPASAVIVSLIDFLISFLLLFILMIWYRISPDWHLITLPFFLGLAFLFSFGFGIWFAALNVKYRDFRYVIPFVVQLGLYVSPVGFTSSVIPGRWRMLYALNPMVGVIDGFRWAILGEKVQIYWPGVWISVGITSLVLIYAINFFRNIETKFADII